MSTLYRQEHGELLESIIREICKSIRKIDSGNLDKFLKDTLEHHRNIRLGPPKKSDSPSEIETILENFLSE